MQKNKILIEVTLYFVFQAKRDQDANSLHAMLESMVMRGNAWNFQYFLLKKEYKEKIEEEVLLGVSLLFT